MDKRKIVLFDIDYTLFNALSYREAFQEELFKKVSSNVDKDTFIATANRIYLETKAQRGFFDPEAFIDLFSLEIGQTLDAQALKNIVLSDKIIEASLYEETVEVLQILSKDPKLTLGIFSAGRVDLQRPKIRLVEEFLHKEHIHIFEFKKTIALPELLKTYVNDDLYIIDDVLSILSEAKKLYNTVTTIWIKRGIYKNTLVGNFVPDATIQNLREVIPILTK